MLAVAGFAVGAAARSAPLQLLPQDAGDASPACLDGSPYGLYFLPSQTNSTKWTVFIDGGGWCYDEDDCYKRSKTPLGTSTLFAAESQCSCMNGDLGGDCNCLVLPYGDGASFSGYRAAPWPVPSQPGANLTFRGIKNLDASLDWAFAHGMDKATEFVLGGFSAGGLSTFLHADRVAARLSKEAPQCAKVVAAPMSGYFLDHGDFRHDGANFTSKMEYVYTMQNLTFGADGALTPACKGAFPEHPSYCFMAPHMQQFIQTPFFMFNSKFDRWQLTNILAVNPLTGVIGAAGAAAAAAVRQYGDDFMSQFAPVQKEPRNGAVIISCICHKCSYGTADGFVDGASGWDHYAAWYNGTTSGAAAIHVDPRNPDGDGRMTDGACSPPQPYPW